jgi:hypothetical protein
MIPTNLYKAWTTGEIIQKENQETGNSDKSAQQKEVLEQKNEKTRFHKVRFFRIILYFCVK